MPVRYNPTGVITISARQSSYGWTLPAREIPIIGGHYPTETESYWVGNIAVRHNPTQGELSQLERFPVGRHNIPASGHHPSET